MIDLLFSIYFVIIGSMSIAATTIFFLALFGNDSDDATSMRMSLAGMLLTIPLICMLYQVGSEHELGMFAVTEEQVEEAGNEE